MAALDPRTARWRKSKRSTDVANCVEVALAGPMVALRDSKPPYRLTIPPPAWSAFTTALCTDEFC